MNKVSHELPSITNSKPIEQFGVRMHIVKVVNVLYVLVGSVDRNTHSVSDLLSRQPREEQV